MSIIEIIKLTLKGEFEASHGRPADRSWDSVETTWKDGGKDRELFLKFMRRMIEWDPNKRATAAELVHDDWIEAHRSDKKS